MNDNMNTMIQGAGQNQKNHSKDKREEIRPDYQLMKVRWIPEEWLIKNLGDVGKVRMCKRVFNNETSDIGDIPFYKIGTFGKEADAFISKELYLDYKEKYSFPKKGDILLSAAGTLGRTVVYDGNPSYFQDSNIVWLDNDESIISNGYLFYVYQIIRYESEGGTIQRLYNKIIRSTKFVLPPLPEQQKIAEVLSTWDKAIENLTQLITEKQQKKKALMQQLLTGKKRFPGFDEEWKSGTIKDIIVESRIPSLSNDPNRRISVKLNLKGVARRDFRGTEKLDSTSYFVRRAGQFVYGKQNLHKGALGIIPAQFDGFESTQDIPAFDFKPEIEKKWFLYVMSKENFYQSLEKISTGTGSKRIQPKELFKTPIEIPSFQEQQKIAEVLNAATKETETLNQKLDALKDQKKGLMQQLLTGKKRLNYDSND